MSAAATAAVDDADDDLTEYERQRLAHVARNREYMARLGVLALASVVGGDGSRGHDRPSNKTTAANAGGTSSSRKRARPSTTGSDDAVRRSSRLQRVAPEHDGSAVDAIDEEVNERRKSKEKAREGLGFATGPAGMTAAAGGGSRGVWASEDAALEASRQWLEDARALMGVRSIATANPSDVKQSKDGVAQAGRAFTFSGHEKLISSASATTIHCPLP